MTGLLATTVWREKKEGMVGIKNIQYHQNIIVLNLANVNIWEITSL